MTKWLRPFAFVSAITASAPALAHPGHPLADSGLLSGLLHPMLGWDHLLTMLVVGIWAAQLGGRARLWVPASFLALMAVGAGLAGLAGRQEQQRLDLEARAHLEAQRLEALRERRSPAALRERGQRRGVLALRGEAGEDVHGDKRDR